jgi:hypothetical protein
MKPMKIHQPPYAPHEDGGRVIIGLLWLFGLGCILLAWAIYC